MMLAWHLARHDILAHRRLLAAWVVIATLHPLLALAPWSTQSVSLAWPPALALVGARLALAASLIATIVQADGPIDELAFWRARPIRPATMATAKLLTLWGVFVGVPLVIVLAVAALTHLPLSHVPSTVAQVVVVESCWVLLVHVIATRTRRTASALVAAVATVIVAVVTFGLVTQAMTAISPGIRSLPDPMTTMPTMALVVLAVLMALSWLAWQAPRRRALATVIIATGFVALQTTFLVPQARLHARKSEPPPLHRDRVEASVTVRALQFPGVSDRVAIVTAADGLAASRDSVERVLLRSGTLTTGNHQVPSIGIQDTREVASTEDRQAMALLALLTNVEFRRLQGTIALFQGSHHVLVRRETTLGGAPLRAGAVLSTPRVRIVLDDVVTPTGETPAIATARMLWMDEVAHRTGRLIGNLYVTDVRGGRRVGLSQRNRERAGLSALVLLPTLAHPFGAFRTALDVSQGDAGLVEPAHATLQLVESSAPESRVVRSSLTFTIPSAVEPASR